MVVKKVSLLFVIMGMIYCEDQNFQFNDTVSQLPKEFKDQVNEEQFKEVQSKVMPLFKEKCEKNGGPHAFSNVENAFTELSTCFNKLVDQEQIKKEIEEASPTGQVDEVFKKYCAKTPQFKGCVDALMTAVRPCLAPDEARNLNTVHNITDQLTEFICFKEGDRIALFIAEGGPECFKAQQEAIQQCLNKTVGGGRQFDPNNVTLDNIPKLEFSKKECNKLVELQNCVVAALDHCEQPTSANIVDSLFNFVRKATPCKDLLNSEPSGGVSARDPLLLLAAAAAAAILL